MARSGSSIRAKLPVLLKMPMQFVLHFVVSAGLAFSIIGGQHLNTNDPGASDASAMDKLRAGSAVFLISWLILVGLTVLSCRYHREVQGDKVVSFKIYSFVPFFHMILRDNWEFLCGGKLMRSEATNMDSWHCLAQLLIAVVLVLPFLGIRILYSLLCVIVNSGALNIVSGNIVLKIILSIVPEMIIGMILVVAGVTCCHVDRKTEDRGSPTTMYPLVPRSSEQDCWVYGV